MTSDICWSRHTWRMQKSTWKRRHWSWNSLPTGIQRGMSSVELQQLSRWWLLRLEYHESVKCLQIEESVMILMFMTKACKFWSKCWCPKVANLDLNNVDDERLKILIKTLMTKGCEELQRVKEMFASCRRLLQRDSQHFPGKLIIIMITMAMMTMPMVTMAMIKMTMITMTMH